jgi:hypothetical protein
MGHKIPWLSRASKVATMIAWRRRPGSAGWGRRVRDHWILGVRPGLKRDILLCLIRSESYNVDRMDFKQSE